MIAHVSGTKPPKFVVPAFLLEPVGWLCESLPQLGRTGLTRQIAWLSKQKIFFSSKKLKPNWVSDRLASKRLLLEQPRII